jgi:hypothetical protein
VPHRNTFPPSELLQRIHHKGLKRIAHLINRDMIM